MKNDGFTGVVVNGSTSESGKNLAFPPVPNDKIGTGPSQPAGSDTVRSDRPEVDSTKYPNIAALFNEPDSKPGFSFSTVPYAVPNASPSVAAITQVANEQAIVQRFQRCFETAVSNYIKFVNDPARWKIFGKVGLAPNHGERGIARVTALKEIIDQAKDMEAIRNALLGYLRDIKTRLDKNSFISYFLDSLRLNTMVLDDLNREWFNKRYLRTSVKIQNTQKDEGQGRLVTFGEKAHLDLGDFTYTEDAANDARDKAFKYFSVILLQPEQRPELIMLKTAVGQAYLAYMTWIQQSPKMAEQEGHGIAGAKYALILADDLAKCYNFQEALKPFASYFSDGLLVKPRAKNHSFISFLLEEFREKAEIIAALNTEWFSVISETLVLSSSNYCDGSATDERTRLLTQFKRLSEVLDKKPAPESEPVRGKFLGVF